MLTALLLLSLSQVPDALPVAHACESASVERPAISLALPDWALVVRPERACEATASAAATMYAMDIDAAEPVTVTELDADIYQED